MSNEAEFIRQMEENRAAYHALRDEIREKYGRQYVAIVFGKLIAAHPEQERVIAIVESLDPKPEHSAVFRADDEDAESSFVPYFSYYQGEYLPWDEPLGEPPPADGMPSTSPSEPSPKH
jgi:hypothetical protein